MTRITILIAVLLPLLLLNAQTSKTIPLVFDESDFTLRSGANDSLFIGSLTHIVDYGEDVNEPGLPLIPVNVLVSQELNYEGHSLDYNKRILKENVNVAHNPVVVTTDEKDMEYNQNAVYTNVIYPSKNVEYVGESYVEGYKLLHFMICPFEYDAVNKTLCFIPNITLNISLKEKDIKTARVVRSDRNISNITKSIIANNQEIDSLPILENKVSITNDALDYLIITSQELATDFYPLVTWKRMKGIRTDIVTTEYIENRYVGNSIQSKIKSCIYERYLNNGIKYVLLGGDDAIVASMGCYGKVNDYVDETIPTDLFYSCFGGDLEWDADGNGIYGELTDSIDYIQSVFVTRAPVRTSNDVTAFVEKIISYEKTPTQYGWGDDILMCGAMIDSKDESEIPQSDSKIEGEYMYNQYIAPYWTGNRIRFYDTYTDYPGGANYDLNSDNLQMQLRQGHIFVDMISHGEQTSWSLEGYNEYDVNHANTLENDIPIIITTTACFTNAFDSSRGMTSDPCLSEAFIRNRNSNVIAYLGCSRYGWAYKGADYRLGPSSMYNALFYQTLLRKNIEGNHFGEIVAAVKARRIASCRQYGHTRWLQFGLNPIGDPEMPIFTETPIEFTNVKIEYDEDSITVCTGISNCVICMMSIDDNGGTYYRVIKNTDRATFHDVSTNVSVCVTKQGYIPYIKELTPIYIQNENVTGTKDYNGIVVKIGSNVTNKKQQGPVTISDGNVSIKADAIVIEPNTTINRSVELKLSNK